MSTFKCPKCGELIETENNLSPQYCSKCGYSFTEQLQSTNNIAADNETSQFKSKPAYESAAAKRIEILAGIIGCVGILFFFILLLGGFENIQSIIIAIIVGFITALNYFLLLGFSEIIENIAEIKTILKDK